MNKQRGFTLIEIAIVLVIIGLLLGGVLKGQELITGARVRNLIGQQDGVKAAYFGFLDRFRALPGDYALATTNINGTTANGNGNGQIELLGAVVSSSKPEEDRAVWEHLSRAGFITGSYTWAATYSTTTGPANPYGSFLVLRYDNGYADTATTIPTRHNLKSGNQIPADLLAEIDRKVDDGLPDTGTFRFSAVAAAGTAPTPASCMTAGTAPAAGTWKLQGSIEPNCGGATVF